MAEYRELLLGCGHRRIKELLQGQPDWTPEQIQEAKITWRGLTTLDINPDCQPDVEWDLSRRLPLPFPADHFDEIHAYEVLEHIGQQGDFRHFFAQFEDFWRILKPNGIFCASTPLLGAAEVWADPGHTRAIHAGTLTYLCQRSYEQLGKTPLTDYRRWFGGDFEIEHLHDSPESGRMFFGMRAVKPARLSR